MPDLPSRSAGAPTLTDRVMSRVTDAGLSVDRRAKASRPKSARRRPATLDSLSAGMTRTPAQVREARSLRRVFEDLGLSYRQYRRDTGAPVSPDIKDAATRFRRELNVTSLVSVAACLDALDIPQLVSGGLLLSLALVASPVDSVVVRDIQVAPGELLRTTSSGAGHPLVLIPGIFGAAFAYRMITGPLAALGYRTIVVEPLGYGWSSHPKDADYSFSAQTGRVGRVLDSLGIRGALIVAQSSGAAIAFRLAILRPDLVRGLLSIDGGPAESAATPGMRQAFKFGGGLVKFALDESKLRHDVRREIVKNSGDTTWVTDAVIRGYTAGQTADMSGSIDAFQRMSKSKEAASLADRLHECAMPIRLLVGTVEHPSEVTHDQRQLLSTRLPNFSADSVTGSGQYIQEEQPAAVLAAVARLAEASR